MPRLLTDDFSATGIQAVELNDDAVEITIGVASSSYAIPADGELLRIALSEDSFIRFGDSGVTVSAANGHYFPKGVEILVVPHAPVNDVTHFAVISGDGVATGYGSITSAF